MFKFRSSFFGCNFLTIILLSFFGCVDRTQAQTFVPGVPDWCVFNDCTGRTANSNSSNWSSYTPPPPSESELRIRGFKASLDTSQNRGFAEKLYAAALRGIARVQKTRGSAAAIAYSEEPSGNDELMAVLNEVADGQLFLAKNTIRATFINASQLAKGVSTELSDDGYQAIFSKTMDDYSKRAANESELDYFIRSDQLILSRDDSESYIRSLMLPLVSSLTAERDRAAAELRVKEKIAQEFAQAEEAREREKQQAEAEVISAHRNDGMKLLGSADSKVNLPVLISLLLNKSVSPRVTLGGNGRMNDETAWKSAKTKVFRNGDTHVVISERLVGDIGADQVQNWAPGLRFIIGSAEPKKDQMVLILVPEIAPNGKGRAEVKLMFGKDWQSTMTNQQAIEAIEKWFPIKW